MSKKLSFNRIIGIVTVILIIVIAMFYNQDKRYETIKFGSTLPLTGPLALYGSALQNGMLLAQDEINQGGKKLDIVFNDNQGNVKTAIQDMNYLYDVMGVPVIFNTFESTVLSTKDIAENKKKLMLSYIVYKYSDKDKVDYNFRDYWNMDSVGVDFAKQANRLNSKKTVILGENVNSYVSFKQGFEKEYTGQITSEEMFEYGETDYRSILTKVKSKEYDTIVIFAFPVEANLILTQMTELGMDNTNLLVTEATENFITEKNKEILQKTDAISYLGSEFLENKQFINDYNKKFGVNPRPDSFYAYENTKLFYKIALECSSDTICMKNKLKDSKQFDMYNNKNRSLPIVRYDNGWEKFD